MVLIENYSFKSNSVLEIKDVKYTPDVWIALVEQELYTGSTSTICYPKTGIDIAPVCIAAPQNNQAPSKQKRIPDNGVILIL